MGVLIFLMMVSFAVPALAQNAKFVSLTGTDLSKAELAPFMTKAFQEGADISVLVNALFKAAIGIGAMLAVLQLARAGFLYMTSDMWHMKDKAKHLIQDAILGLLILMSVWLVLNQINPQLLNLNALEGVENIQTTSAPSTTPPPTTSPPDDSQNGSPVYSGFGISP